MKIKNLLEIYFYRNPQAVMFCLGMLIFLKTNQTQAQQNFLGKSQEYIYGLYTNDPEYEITTDTVHFEKVVIKCKGVQAYPYYTYEIDLLTDRCVSYGFVSKNREVLKTYIEILEYIGTVAEKDSVNSKVTYVVKLPKRKVIYTIKQPYAASNVITKQGLFYILVREEKEK